MEPSTIAVRLASAVVAPLVKKLFVKEGPGAGLVTEPTRIAGLVSFRGEKDTLLRADVEKLAARLVHRANRSGPERSVPEADEEPVALAVAHTLAALGDIGMTDVQAVGLGHEVFARELTAHARHSARALSADATSLHDRVVETACLHILDFFTKRSTFVARTLAEQTGRLEQLVHVTDLLAERLPSRTAQDARFEEQYARHIVRKHGELTIYGLDLHRAREWPLDTAYISLETTHDSCVPLPAESALAGQQRVLLRGPAGCGKTTLVQWLAVTTARQSGADGQPLPEPLSQLVGRVPFVLPLRRVVREGLPPAPDRFLHAAGSTSAGAQPDGWADRVLRAGRGLLLVDGIDEIPEREREDVRRWMRDMLGDFPGNVWLATSRPSAVRDEWLRAEHFTELTLSPMSRDDIAAFVRRWHDAAGAEGGEALLEAIRTSGDLNRLATSPLMCGLLCALHRERHGSLPRSRKELYEAALSMLLERRDTERGIRAIGGLHLDKENQTRLLQKLAHWLIRNNRAEMDRPDAVARIEAALPYMPHVPSDPERVFHHLLDRSGLLREPAAGRVDFVHRTFQDYLGAQAVVEEGDFPLLLDNAEKDQWEDVVRMAVAHARPAERGRILRGLIQQADARNTRPLLLAMACLDQATEVNPEVYRLVTHNAAALLPPADTEMARRLGDSGGPLLLGLLPGPEGLAAEQAENTVIAATRIGTDAAQAFLARYRTHPSLTVRRQLVWGWHRFDTRSYADEIVRHLDPTDLYFTAPTPAHLDALARLGGRPRIQIPGPYDPRDLTGVLGPRGITHLWLRSGYLPDSTGREWLSDFPDLVTLVLPAEPPGAARIPQGVEVVLGEPPER